MDCEGNLGLDVRGLGSDIGSTLDVRLTQGVRMWQEDDDMLVPPQDFNDVIEPMEGVWQESVWIINSVSC